MKNNISTERAVIGCMMSDQDCAEEGFLSLEAKDFSDNDCRRIFSAMECLNVANQPIDLTSVAGMFENSFLKTISEIFSDFYLPSNFKSYCVELEKASKLRKFLGGMTEIAKCAKEGDVSAIDEMQNLLDEINTVENSEMKKIAEAIPYALDDLSNPSKGIPTGFPQLDKITKGLVRGNLVVVAGRPSMGKSAFAENIALNVAKRGKVVAFFSLEMKDIEIAQRLLYMYNWVGEREILTDSRKSGKIMDSLNDFENLKFYLHDSGGLNINKIQTHCKKIKKKEFGLDLVVIDYIGLVKTFQRKNGSRTQEIGELCHALKQMAQ